MVIVNHEYKTKLKIEIVSGAGRCMDEPAEVKTTIDADLTWGNVHAWFKVFSNVLLQAGFSERAIMAGGAQLAFNEWRSDEDMRSVAKEYDLVMVEHATEPEEPEESDD